MKIALTHNLKLTSTIDEAEFDTPETIDALANALASRGHDVERVEVSGPASRLVARLEAYSPDLIFNTAEGKRGRAREAFYPALFDELGFPYTGSDAYTLAVTLDKALTKKILAGYGVPSPRGRFVTRQSLGGGGLDDFVFPVIVKPDFEGSSKGISDKSVAEDAIQLARVLEETLELYPAGLIVEQYIGGKDVTVPFINGIGPDGILEPVEYLIAPSYKRRYDIYDYHLKNEAAHLVSVRCPAEIDPGINSRIRELARRVVKALDIRDMGRVDFRLGRDGDIHFLEVNGLPSLEPGAGLFAAAERTGADYPTAVNAIVHSAAQRHGLAALLDPRAKKARKKSGNGPFRVGFTFNLKRVKPVEDGSQDHEAEFDPPKTIEAIRDAIASYGHTVVMLEATSELARTLSDQPVDFVFNIAEGMKESPHGRNREALIPALCELLGIPFTGSDSATLGLCLDKGLTKKILKQHDIETPEFQIFETGRERINKALRFPLIVKPVAEGTSKGIGDKSVVETEEALREVVLQSIERYAQPALVEEYITGREFTVGLLGENRPRVLPPMEIVFTDASMKHPVYSFAIKQDWDKHVAYECPAKLTPVELRNLERAAKETFEALDCRDVARVDLRMAKDGTVYVIEVNPLPGLTPNFSDLVLIAQAAGLDYRTLIGEIMSGAIKRLKERRRDENRDRVNNAAPNAIVAAPATNGHTNGNGTAVVADTPPGEKTGEGTV
jgi:D-alanine--D-alanine ligase